MQNNIEIINKRNSVEINIEGTIGVPEAWQFDEPKDRIATYDKFREVVDLIRQLEAAEIIVNIRSTGGDVNDALLIHDAISSLKAKKKTRCYGYVASAATIIAQAASQGCREISANSLYLIHNSSCASEGNAAELATKIDLLQQTDARIAGVYSSRSGRSADEFALLMAENNGSGRWLSPQEVIDSGLADAIITMPEVLNFIVKDEKPIQNNMTKIKNTYTSILRHLGLATGETTEIEISDSQIENLNQLLEQNEKTEQDLRAQIATETSALAVAQNRVSTLEAELAQAKAQPTKTKDIEDPTPGAEGTASGNAKSYASDIQNFKQ